MSFLLVALTLYIQPPKEKVAKRKGVSPLCFASRETVAAGARPVRPGCAHPCFSLL